MIETTIEINKPFISLNYDINRGVTSGDNFFLVNLLNIGDEESDNTLVTVQSEDKDVIIEPSEFEIEPGSPQTVSIRLSDSATIEEGIYNFSLTFKNEYAADRILNASLLAKESIESKNSMQYKLKYFIQRDNYTANIYQNVPAGQELIPIEINGTCDLSYQEKSDLYEPIVSATLKMRLEASLDLSLQDLYSEDEKTYKIQIVKNSKIIFSGFILPDEIWEDYVADKWELEITANDGLSALKNISFSNENGTYYFGRMNAMSIISICLGKTALELPIISNCEIMYVNMFPTNFLSVFYNIFLSIERYFQNQREPMDCDSVLRSVLQIFNCTVHQRDNAWYIYRPVDLKPQMVFFRNTPGLFLEPVFVNPGDTLGSHINGFSNFHCSGNQKKSIAASVQAYKITYEYGLSYSFFLNPNLYFNGGGLTMDGWIVNNPDNLVTRDESGHGVRSITKWFGGNAPALLTLNQSINITAGSAMKLRIEYANASKYKQPNSESSKGLTFSIGVGGQWLAANGTWGGSQERIFISNSSEVTEPTFNGFLGRGIAIYEADILSPVSGLLQIIIWRDKHEIGGGTFVVYSVNLTGSNQSQTKGMEYIGRRTEKISTKVKSNVTVYNGDSITDLFVGTIFKRDVDTPTDLWTRYYFDNSGNVQPLYDNAPVLSINVEDNLRISPRPMTIFEGDFKGYMQYMNVITIDGFANKKFQFTKYSYSLDTNTTKAVLKEFESEIMPKSDFDIDSYETFGEETKVTLIS